MEGEIMKVKIEPRNKTDVGGILCMPLKQNIPNPKDKSWKLTTCRGCGRECWDRPIPDGYSRSSFGGKLCTECAIRKMCQ